MINYKIRSGKNCRSQKKHYFAVIASMGHVGFEQIAAEISAKSTTTRADVAAVLTALEEIIPQKLSNSHSVRLGRLGAFRPTIRCRNGHADKSDVSPSDIRSVNCRFLPGPYLRKELEIKNLSFSLKK